MPVDLQFNDTNINGHSTIPATAYPTLADVAVEAVEVNHSTKKIIAGALADGNDVFFTWDYPSSDNLYVHVAVGHQLQIFEGELLGSDAQASFPPLLSFEQISDLKSEASPNNYIDLSTGASGRYDIAPGLLRSGTKYTVRVRSLVFSEKGAGTVSSQYFKYTEWGSAVFSVNSPPAAVNLRVNNLTNPTRIPSTSPVSFTFTFTDVDGPQYLYRVQVGTTPGIGFTADVWDSGLIFSGQAFGSRDFEIPYTGPTLDQGTVYAWRVQVEDGLSDGGYTSAQDLFRINSPATVSSLTADGNELLVATPPMTGNTGVQLSWVFDDSDGDTQKAYALRIVQTSPDSPTTEIKYPATFTTGATVTLPTLEDNSEVEVFISVRDNTEFGPEVSGTFLVNARPVATNFLIDGETNPGDVATATPTFSWDFSDATPGDSQQQYRIQVADADDFLTLLWDTGDISSDATSVIYGSTPAPAVAAATLTHGQYYYARVKVSDGVSFSEYSIAFFAVNTRPESPLLLTPSTGAFSGLMSMTWTPVVPEDADGDTVTFSVEMTSRRSTNTGWTFLAGPFPSSTTSYDIDLDTIRSGNDYGVRVVANDGFADSDPTSGTSPVNGVGLGFTILNHAPTTPAFVSPASGATVSASLKVEWLEQTPADVDGDSVFYILEITRDITQVSPTWENVGVFSEGTSAAVLSVSDLPDGSDYRLRITAKDSKGADGTVNESPTFSIINTTAISDFQTFGGRTYLATTDGRLLRGSETIWQVDEDWGTDHATSKFEEFSRGAPEAKVEDGYLVITSPSGSTYMLRQAKGK